MSGKKIPLNVPAAPLDNISFHSEQSAQRWRYVYQRRIARERELHGDALKCKDIMSLLKAAGLMNTVYKVGRCYERLVNEFIVNVSPEVGRPGHEDHYKVYVRGCCVNFSPAEINKFLERNADDIPDEDVSLNSVVKELTARKVNIWPSKGKILSSQLSVKYAILHKISAANWAPTSHTSNINASLARLLFAIGTKSKIDFGSYVFEKTLKHGESFAVKMSIAFPCLITEMIISQHPAILRDNEEEFPKGHSLNFDYRLFVGTHVKDIEDKPAKESGHSGLRTQPVKEDILSELIDTSKALQETIRICTDKKIRIDKLIMQIQAEKEAVVEEDAEEDGEEAAEEKEEDPADKGKGVLEGGSKEAGEDSEDEDTSATDTD